MAIRKQREGYRKRPEQDIAFKVMPLETYFL
jgi:hypothetical protein